MKTPESPSSIVYTVLKSIIATASLMIPSPKSTAFKTGNLSGFINDIAATVSVAQSTLLKRSIYLIESLLKNKWSRNFKQIAKQKKQMTVPTTPKKLIIPKF